MCVCVCVHTHTHTHNPWKKQNFSSFYEQELSCRNLNFDVLSKENTNSLGDVLELGSHSGFMSLSPSGLGAPQQEQGPCVLLFIVLQPFANSRPFSFFNLVGRFTTDPVFQMLHKYQLQLLTSSYTVVTQ